MKAIFLVVVVLLVTPAALSQVPDDKLIVPGVRIGKWTLAMTIDDLLRLNGPAENFGPLTAGDIVPPPPQRYFWGDFAAITRDGRNVAFLYIGDRSFRTEKGVGPTSRRVAIENAYGRPPAETVILTGRTRWIYDAIGLAVVIEQDQVNVMNVFKPGTGRSIFNF